MSEAAPQQKAALRADARERRRNMTLDTQVSSAQGIRTQLQALVAELGAKRLGCYLSTVDEPPTRAFIEWALEQDIEVLLPISRDDGLLDWAHFSAGDEGVDSLGMPIPLGDVLGPVAIDTVDVLLIPASLVDRDGMRMGWGRGYFDRTLGSMGHRPPIFAVVYDHEVVDSVPREAHDQPVDGVVTPSGIIRFS